MLRSTTALGEIDRSTVALFSARLRDAVDRSDEALVNIDCSGVTFMDSAGYRALVDATRYAVRHGHTLVVRDMSSACATLIGVCNTGGDLRLGTATTAAGMQRRRLRGLPAVSPGVDTPEGP